MKLKKYWKRFWTLDRHHAAGFTLVELIVVIAILAILAGVGIPVYSGYIKKANIGADETLAAGIKSALEIGTYTQESISGYVILSDNAAPVIVGTGVLEAVQAAYGTDLDGLLLKHNGWVVNGSMLNAALSFSNPGAVGNSSYIQNSATPELLDNVQTVTSAAAGVLGAKARSASHMISLLKTTLGEGYLEKAAASGVIKKNDDGSYALIEGTYTDNGDGTISLTPALQNQLSNLMVFSVAAEMKEPTQEEMMMMMGIGIIDGAANPNPSVYSDATVLAARYALLKAFALEKGGDAEKDFDQLNTNLLAVKDGDNALTQVKTLFDNYIAKYKTDLEAFLFDEETEDFSSAYYDNADAITSIMGGVSSVENQYANADSLANGSLYTSDAVTGDLNAYIGASELAAAMNLTDAQKAQLAGVTSGIVILVGPSGVVVVGSAG